MEFNEYDEAAQQQNRKNRALYEHMVVRQLDPLSKTAVIESSDGTSFYSVTLTSCTCPDFVKRHKPCKHMYKLQNVLNATHTTSSGNRRTIAALLCIFLGPLGAHYFYVKRFGMGLLYLFTAGLFCFGWLYDIFRILSGHFCDKYGEIL